MRDVVHGLKPRSILENSPVQNETSDENMKNTDEKRSNKTVRFLEDEKKNVKVPDPQRKERVENSNLGAAKEYLKDRVVKSGVIYVKKRTYASVLKSKHNMRRSVSTSNNI